MTRQDGRWDEVWVFLARDQNGKEWMIQDLRSGRPLVHADRQAADLWLPAAREIAAADPTVTVELVRFSQRISVQRIEGKRT
jgi:hypothetical protein